MRTVSFLGCRGLIALALAVGVLWVAGPGDASGQKTTTPQTTTKAQGKTPAHTTTQTPSQNQAHTQTQGEHPSHISVALYELKKARTQLHEARHDFGGRREQALRSVDHAIHELEEIVHYETQHETKGKRK